MNDIDYLIATDFLKETIKGDFSTSFGDMEIVYNRLREEWDYVFTSGGNGHACEVVNVDVGGKESRVRFTSIDVISLPMAVCLTALKTRGYKQTALENLLFRVQQEKQT